MPDFRYAQFCPVARAAEILGERWTLLVVRELLFGPQRFSDLRRGLPGVSSSVLAERLARLEERELVSRRELPPPAPATVYELTATGRALQPVIFELARWGVRFLADPQPGDHLPPRALRVGLGFAARREPTPPRRFVLCAADGESEERFLAAGGSEGTRLETLAPEADAPRAPDVTIRGRPFALAALASGRLDPAVALRNGSVEAEGDTGALAELPLLFDLQRPQPEIPTQPPKPRKGTPS